MSEAGKGDTQRPTDQEAFSKGWEAVFGKKPSEELKQRYSEADCLKSEQRWQKKEDSK
jgi:hypothetical protein